MLNKYKGGDQHDNNNNKKDKASRGDRDRESGRLPLIQSISSVYHRVM